MKFKLTGKSLLDLKKEGLPFWSNWWENENFAKEKSTKGIIEVDITTDNSLYKKTLNHNVAEIEEILAKKGQKLMSITDIAEVYWQYYKKTKKYLWSGTWTFTSSRCEGHVVSASFGSDGWLFVDSGLDPDDAGSFLGGRSSAGSIPLKFEPLSSFDAFDLKFAEANEKLDRVLEILERHFK